jgi:hypothetical protein
MAAKATPGVRIATADHASDGLSHVRGHNPPAGKRRNIDLIAHRIPPLEERIICSRAD